jgi:elongation factor Ts
MTISSQEIKDLRSKTGAGFMDCKKALQESNGDFGKAVEYLRKKGLAKAAKRADREASEGVLELYNHGDGRVGVMLELNCETDFVARSTAFRQLAHELALQIAAMAPLWIREDDIPAEVLEKEREIAREQTLQEGKPEHIVERIVEGRINKFKGGVVLLRQPYIRDDKKTIEQYLHENIASIGENIVIRRFTRWALGETSATS